MKLWRNRHRQNLSALFGVVLLLVVAGVWANHKAGERSQQLAQAAGVGKLGVLGETYKAENYSLSLGKVGSYPVDETSGIKRHIAEVTIKNLSAYNFEISPGLQMSLRDARGIAYMATARYLAEGEVIGGPLGPGASSEIKLDFDLPSTVVPVEFIFQADAATQSTVIRL